MTAEIFQFPKLVTRPRITIAQLVGRFGIFYIADAALNSWPDLVLQIMGQCIVMHATRGHDHTLYTAISEHFEIVAPERPTPIYEWRFDQGAMRPYVVDRRDR